MSVTGVIALMSTAKLHVIDCFKDINATSVHKAVALDKLEINYKKYGYAKAEFDNMLKAGLIKINGDNYWFDEETYESQNIKIRNAFLITLMSILVITILIVLVMLFKQI